MKYAELIIANNSNKTDRFYTYGCTFPEIRAGQKVYAPFSLGNKLKEAYVFSVHEEENKDIKGLKYIESIDDEISITEESLKTCEWMRKRYSCRYMDAINCFTPGSGRSKTGKKRNPLLGAVGEKQEIESLTKEQTAAVDKVTTCIKAKKHNIFLLHGVTGSGKTEVYMQAISSCIGSGRTAIMLVPEISLTPQIIARFIDRFGSGLMAVLHSRLSPGERYDEWVRIRSGAVKIVIGARSAVFAPLENIGAVILDEEHETTYKSDVTPRYDTVEIAIKRVKTQKNKGIVILGSATPSVVSSYRAQTGLYEKIELSGRHNEAVLPEVEIADMRGEMREGNRSIFSRVLYSEMQKRLTDGQQVILFLNRRGYSTFISCRECGYVMRCKDCGISLTYHKSGSSANCHYCGYKEDLPEACPECGSKYIRHFGAGTEKVEEEARALFPDHETDRLDLDAIRRKGDLEKVLSGFRRGRTKILVGTQLVAKGLDFKNVGLVGVISADSALNIPDFRAAERAFQLITQAAGRAGRGGKAGKVIIQTYAPDHYSILSAANHDYKEFYEKEIILRKLMKYPPFSDLIQTMVTADNEEDAINGAETVFAEIKKRVSNEDLMNIFPPHAMTLFKQSGVRYQILIKSEPGRRNEFMEILTEIKKDILECDFTMGIDVNPYSFM